VVNFSQQIYSYAACTSPSAWVPTLDHTQLCLSPIILISPPLLRMPEATMKQYEPYVRNIQIVTYKPPVFYGSLHYFTHRNNEDSLRRIKYLLFKCQPHLHGVQPVITNEALRTEAWRCNHYT